MGIFRFIFTCITQAIKIAIGIAITIALFFAMGYLIDVFAARKTPPPADSRLKPYADRGMPLTGKAPQGKDTTESLYLSFFETLLDKKPDHMPDPPITEQKPEAEAGQKSEYPLRAAKPAPAQNTQPQPLPGKSAASQRVAEIRAALAGEEKPAPDASETITYTLQLGSFQNNDVASSFTSSLAAKGYEATISKITVADKGVVYRVRLGKYTSLEDAQKAAAELAKKEGISAFITSK